MSAQTDIIAKYGQPGPAYQGKYCMIWEVQKDFPWFPAKKIFINKDFKDKLYTAFKALEARGIQDEIKTFDGCYNERTVRGSTKLSLHDWAMALDMNAKTEKLGQTFTHWSPAFAQTMKDAGIFWGFDYKGRKDPMHWSLYLG